MITKSLRDTLVDSLEQVDFSYGDWDDPTVQIIRKDESFTKKAPWITVGFFPANRRKFRSVSDAIGWKQEGYLRYGYCQIELVDICCNVAEFQHDKEIPGRDFCYNMAYQVLHYILGNWESLLKEEYAAFDRDEDLNIRDETLFLRRQGTKVYKYSISVYLRTQMVWDKVPPTYESTVVESIGIKLNDDEIRIISE